MNILDYFAFDVLEIATGRTTRVLTEEDAARICGADVDDVGAALEWYSTVCWPDSFLPTHEITRIEINGRTQ